MLLNTLLAIYVSLMVLDMLFMVTLHFLHDRKGYYKTAAGIWIGLLTSFAMDGVVAAEYPGMNHLFGIGFANIMSYYLGKLASDIYRLNIPSRRFLKISLAMWLLALVLHFVCGARFTLTAFCVVVGIAIAPIYAAFRIMAQPKNDLSIIDRMFAVLLLLEGIHMLDYPLLRNTESTAIFGFSFGAVLVYFASMMIPVVINRRISADFNETLQKSVDEKTERLQEAQQQLFNTSKLAALGEMAGGVAHEINNPIAIIILRSQHIVGLVERIDQDPSEAKSNLEKIKKFSQVVLSTANRIAEIVSGLRTFARSGVGDPLQLENLAKILNDTLALCMSRMTDQNIKVVQNIDRTVQIKCRPVQISQVILNILSNATYELSHADQESRTIQIDVYKKDREAIIAISDNGRGIPADVVEKIMQPFFTTKPVGEGTGLGLSISKGIIDSHHGHIEVVSEPGNTCFKVKLPCASL